MQEFLLPTDKIQQLGGLSSVATREVLQQDKSQNKFYSKWGSSHWAGEAAEGMNSSSLPRITRG